MSILTALSKLDNNIRIMILLLKYRKYSFDAKAGRKLETR